MDATLEGGTLWTHDKPKENFPIGALIYINGNPLKIAKIEDDDKFGFRIILEQADDLQAKPFLGAFVFPVSKS